jgi:hypothetical protein
MKVYLTAVETQQPTTRQTNQPTDQPNNKTPINFRHPKATSVKKKSRQKRKR